MLIITPTLTIAEEELEEKFVAASGPGGQNVNKVATAVQLRFNVRRSPALPEEVRARLLLLAGNRVTAEGVLIIDAHRFRTQEQNRQDARQRLADLIRAATHRRKPRRPTRASPAARARRLEGKKLRGQLKRQRHIPPETDD